ncbi:MAG: hypothetical protein ABIJ75_00800 [Actinomycetota bacterium]
MAKKKPRDLRYRPVYAVALDPSGTWRVTGCRGRRGRGGFADRADAVAHAEHLASGHVVAQVQVFDADGSLVSDRALFDPEMRQAAEAFLEAYLAPFRDIAYTSNLLEGWEYAENLDLRIGDDVVRLSLSAHEGQMYDEIHVSGSIWDEFLGPRIAEDAFVLWPGE